MSILFDVSLILRSRFDAGATGDIRNKDARPVPAFYVTLYTDLTSVLLYDPVWLYVVYPAVLAAPGSVATDGIVLTVRQAVQTKLNQENFLWLSREEGAGLTGLSQIEKIN